MLSIVNDDRRQQAAADISLNNTTNDDNKVKERNNCYKRFLNPIQIPWNGETSSVR